MAPPIVRRRSYSCPSPCAPSSMSCGVPQYYQYSPGDQNTEVQFPSATVVPETALKSGLPPGVSLREETRVGPSGEERRLVVTMRDGINPSFIYYGRSLSALSSDGVCQLSRARVGLTFDASTIASQDSYIHVRRNRVTGSDGGSAYEYHISFKPALGAHGFSTGALDPDKVALRIGGTDYELNTNAIASDLKQRNPGSHDLAVPAPSKKKNTSDGPVSGDGGGATDALRKLVAEQRSEGLAPPPKDRTPSGPPPLLPAAPAKPHGDKASGGWESLPGTVPPGWQVPISPEKAPTEKAPTDKAPTPTPPAAPPVGGQGGGGTSADGQPGVPPTLFAEPSGESDEQNRNVEQTPGFFERHVNRIPLPIAPLFDVEDVRRFGKRPTRSEFGDIMGDKFLDFPQNFPIELPFPTPRDALQIARNPSRDNAKKVIEQRLRNIAPPLPRFVPKPRLGDAIDVVDTLLPKQEGEGKSVWEKYTDDIHLPIPPFKVSDARRLERQPSLGAFNDILLEKFWDFPRSLPVAPPSPTLRDAADFARDPSFEKAKRINRDMLRSIEVPTIPLAPPIKVGPAVDFIESKLRKLVK